MADVGAVALGAVLALVAQATIQLYVVPRVDARKRREDRWERDVRDLGELLSGPIPLAATAARSKQHLLLSVREAEDDPRYPPERVKLAIDEALTDAKNRSQKLQDLSDKGAWIADQIYQFDESANILRRLHVLYLGYQFSAGTAHFLAWLDDDFTVETHEGKWDEEAAARKAVLEVLKDLQRRPTPPRTQSRLHPRNLRRIVKRLHLPRGRGRIAQ